MTKYRKKPVVIEAVEFIGVDHGALKFGDLTEWLSEAVNKLSTESGAVFRAADGVGATVTTLEGNHYAQPGDWIIRGVKGELYPCKPDIFAATYEPA